MGTMLVIKESHEVAEGSSWEKSVLRELLLHLGPLREHVQILAILK